MNQTLSLKEKKFLFLILTSVFLIKIIFIFTIPTLLKSDSLTYNELATSILSGSYSINGKSTAFVVCGYPLFLSGIYSVFGEGQFFIKLIQSILEIFTGYLFFKVSLNFFNTKYSLVSLAVFSFLPSNLLYTQTVLTESLFGFFAILVLYFCLKKRFLGNIFLTGLFFGCAIMVRSSFSVAVLLVPLYLFLEREKLFSRQSFLYAFRYSAIFFAGVILILAPWIIRNKIEFNSFTLATQGGSTLWEGNNPQATGTWNQEMVESNPLFDHPDEIYREKEFYRLAVDFIINNPVEFIKLGIKKIAYLFSSERMIILYFVESVPGETSTQVYKGVNPLILAFVNIPYFLVMLAGTWGLLAWREKNFFIYGFILVWMITIFIFVGLARYHYVLIPFFVIGTVNFLAERKTLFENLSITKKILGIGFSIFLIGIWISEIYLMYK